MNGYEEVYMSKRVNNSVAHAMLTRSNRICRIVVVLLK